MLNLIEDYFNKITCCKKEKTNKKKNLIVNSNEKNITKKELVNMTHSEIKIKKEIEDQMLFKTNTNNITPRKEI